MDFFCLLKTSHAPPPKKKTTWTFEFVNSYLFLVHRAMFLPYELSINHTMCLH